MVHCVYTDVQQLQTSHSDRKHRYPRLDLALKVVDILLWNNYCLAT